MRSSPAPDKRLSGERPIKHLRKGKYQPRFWSSRPWQGPSFFKDQKLDLRRNCVLADCSVRIQEYTKASCNAACVTLPSKFKFKMQTSERAPELDNTRKPTHNHSSFQRVIHCRHCSNYKGFSNRLREAPQRGSIAACHSKHLEMAVQNSKKMSLASRASADAD